MNNIKNIVLFTLLAMYSFASAQTNTDTPDALYRNFSKAYAELNSEQLVQLYTTDANIINLYRQQPPGSYTGQAEIAVFYRDYFQTVARHNQKMELSFKIVQRKTTGEHSITDCGYFALQITEDGKTVSTLYGKFCTQLQQEKDHWEFKTDAATDATAQEYEQASTVSINHKSVSKG
ncbi:hypothetical protein EZL74_10090 [Flavobacterium silvisoli]|uniref:Nuclear transport factor 2 family protein n=1 Tax=Flavobacterium silvisoli TaxID=2529433 RepID=A0A4V2L4K1_9FLAO|nr:hypothetical protein [Flavobacterium silvisoli]TBX67001.1 hypothetical protein EZL74_10090 [Flavobacterium silvisoli]